ncbi:Uncharacterized protein BM_BM13012 [Brugia malayi]|uniref:Bm13012 n=1 Tax=Brugia malayi TaxID=6279 RepID=A0A0J9YGM0_BRUMA|nr:Uncharacterized protein BM_BM13012 [Brugia malayi]CDQ08429.1 Bm13012 [Brugia malayi]VIP00417.1 Uncharacterized protein BM_BM13012 [Brugia malayi]
MTEINPTGSTVESSSYSVKKQLTEATNRKYMEATNH